MSFKILLLAVAIGLYAFGDDLFSRSFPVHEEGAVLVTGATSGIGLSIAKHLKANTKFDVFATYRKPADAQKLEALGLHPLKLDVRQAADVEKAVSAIEKHGKPLVGLVNNAGWGMQAPLEWIDWNDARDMLESNIIGTIQVTRAFVPLLRKAEGRIVFIGSIAGRVGAPLSEVYSSTKFAIRGFALSLRPAMAHNNVAVSLIEPGFILTRGVLSQDDDPVDWSSKSEQERKLYPNASPNFRRKTNLEIVQATAGTTALTDADVLKALTARKPRFNYVQTKLRFVAYFLQYMPDWLNALIEDNLVVGPANDERWIKDDGKESEYFMHDHFDPVTFEPIKK